MWVIEVVQPRRKRKVGSGELSSYRAPRSALGLGRADAAVLCLLGYKQYRGLSSGRRAASLLLRVCEDEYRVKRCKTCCHRHHKGWHFVEH